MLLPDEEVRRLNQRLSEPYEIPEHCPYFSEEQRELSRLPFEKRSEWMADWLAMAQGVGDE